MCRCSVTAMDEAPAYETGHLILPKNPLQKILCNFSHQKN